MTARETALQTLLDSVGWGQAERLPLAGDASNRRYERLVLGHRTTVLMDAPSERGEDVRPFMDIAAHLAGIGLRPPRILAADADAGYLLLEDFGDALFARVLEDTPDLQETLYAAALDVLIRLSQANLPSVPDYGPSEMASAATLATDWYAETPAASADLAALMKTCLSALDWSHHVLVLRDYHAENLIWLPGASDVRRVGLLDFQNAERGHRLYDLVSLLQDARRDVPRGVEDHMKSLYFVKSGGGDRAGFDLAYATLGAQRALRILGVFARLSLHFNKPAYVDLIPRVWGQLETNLAQPGLEPLRGWVETHLPQPTGDRLNALKSRAGTCPTL